MPQRIGRILVEQQILTEDQCDQVLSTQARTRRPFGEIAEELFGIPATDIEKAWAAQYAKLTRWVDPVIDRVDPATLGLINRRQAWQFGVLPMGYNGGELIICTTQSRLVRALNFVTRHLHTPCFFVLAMPDSLADALMRHYPMDGMNREILQDEHPLRMAS